MTLYLTVTLANPTPEQCETYETCQDCLVGSCCVSLCNQVLRKRSRGLLHRARSLPVAQLVHDVYAVMS